MNKMIGLIKNEFIKTFKKVSTIILFVLVILIGIGFTAVMYFAKNAEDNYYYDYVEGDDMSVEIYKERIKDAQNEKYGGYEYDIEMYEQLIEKEIIMSSWRYNVVSLAYETSLVYDEETGETTYDYAHDKATRDKLLGFASEGQDNWKLYCQFMIDYYKSTEFNEAEWWEYQYRLDNNIPLSDTEEDYSRWDDMLVRTAAEHKIVMSDPMASDNEKDDAKKNFDICMYRLDNKIETNVADSLMDSDMPSEFNIWTCLANSTMLISIIGLLIVVIAGGSVSNEFSRGTIKFLLVNPVKRWKILVSKYITCLLTGYALIFLFYVVTVLLSMVFFGASDIGAPYITFSGGKVTSTPGLLYLFKEYMLASVEVLVITTMAFAISSLVKSSALAIGISVFSLFAGSTVVSLLASLRQDWARFLIFSNVDLSTIAAGGSMFPNHSLVFAIGVIIAHMIVFGLIAWDGFTKKEV